MTDIIDRIDELVDEQLAGGEPLNGYDFGDPEYPRCPHCGRHWHGLPITQRIARMYAIGRYDPEYNLAKDDSPILCDGSDFIGPRRPPLQLGQARCVIVPVFQLDHDVAARLREHLLQIQAQWERMAVQMAAAFDSFQMLVGPGSFTILDEPRRLCEPCAPPTDITVEFGPQNWHYELQPPPPGWPVGVMVRVRRLWREFTAPDYPVPERPGYDFSHYADDDDPTWALTADTRARSGPRPAHTTARPRRRGRSQHGG